MRIVVALLVAAVATGCVVRYLKGPQLTGTCGGACDHYVTCRGSEDGGVRAACQAECPEVFSDRDSLMSFESLSCEATLEFVEGPARRPLGSPASTVTGAR
ncbi:MAG: hypothetical protein IPL61_17655 [Myxococcales bacterium]|nr:hypothetical protein [Myxococcales bacterium]